MTDGAEAAGDHAVGGAAQGRSGEGRMFSVFEWSVALRYLRARRSSGFVSVIAVFSFLGITLGVATLIVVMSVMNGFHRELMDKILGVNGHAFVQAIDAPFTDWESVAASLSKIPGVELAAPMVEGAAGASTPYGQTGVLARGLRGKDLLKLPGVASTLRDGSFENFDNAGGVAIGQRLAEKLGVRVGDKISLLSAKGAQTPFGVTPRIKAYPIAAIFQIGMSEFDNLFVYLPLREAQNFFNKDNEVTTVEVFVANPEAMDAFRAAVDKEVTRPVIITDWRQMNKTFFDTLQVEKNILFIILTLIVIVAAFNIVSGLTMLVKDKTRDIAILRTMGATRGSVLRIFLIIGASIGTTGAFVGFLLGLLIAKNLDAIRLLLNKLLDANLFPAELYFLSRLPSIVEPREVMLVVGMTVTLAILASIYPAWKAASLDPIQALRSE
ncbi:lipoprotein-releasing ABC transporter permease subunit [Methylocystis heyeri]|uniref:Lipoprotein-releasing ABC transporter permease subunit n=1 Tax=Methylocystis heyeri TaxID=391905 RepID=A0A6B8KG88_9HYPH|nr:lipoprotein-releasing ABC transporter permease subunit [Methylocystis heyeri]QGM45568.1 lipoprotein-releasing ABC transporter permease subunit [Methylocystis heyeri]